VFQTIIAGLVVTLASGLAFVAYKHPRDYRKLFRLLVFVVVAILIFHTAYIIGFENGFSTAMTGVYKLNKNIVVLTPSHKANPLWTPLLGMLVIGYLGFLLLLPSILHSEKGGKDS